MERVSAQHIFSYNPGDHVSRYIWALNFLKNKLTLDCGCGEGYGTKWLQLNGVTIVGIDVSSKAIHNASKYSQNYYILGDILNMPFRNNTFDSIISFEVIEHLVESEVYMENIYNVLKKGGIFIGSTPIRKKGRYVSGKPINPFHKKEFYIDELSNLLNKYFSVCVLFGQKFPNQFIRVILSSLNKINILKTQYCFYPIHNKITKEDEKCIWICTS